MLSNLSLCLQHRAPNRHIIMLVELTSAGDSHLLYTQHHGYELGQTGRMNNNIDQLAQRIVCSSGCLSKDVLENLYVLRGKEFQTMS